MNILYFTDLKFVSGPIWNRQLCGPAVQITMSETFGIGTRGAFFTNRPALPLRNVIPESSFPKFRVAWLWSACGQDFGAVHAGEGKGL